MTTSDDIFRPDGTLAGVSFGAAAKRRGAVLQINLGRGGPDAVTTSLLVDGKDFPSVYDEAVKIVARYHGVTDELVLLKMQNSIDAFMKASGLKTQRVEIVYQQVIKTNPEAKPKTIFMVTAPDGRMEEVTNLRGWAKTNGLLAGYFRLARNGEYGGYRAQRIERTAPAAL